MAKSPTRSPGIRRAIERAAALGFSVHFVEFVASGTRPAIVPPQGLCDREARRIFVGTRDLAAHGMPMCSRAKLQAIIEHENEHAEGKDRATDRPEFGLICGGMIRPGVFGADGAPDPLRAAAWLALRACVDTLAYFEENEAAEHGRRDLGHAWSAASESAQALREALGLNRRFTVEPIGDGDRWELMDKGHPLAKTHGAQCVARGYGAGEAFALAEWCNSIDRAPVGLDRAQRMTCNCCGGVTLGRQWPNRDTGFSLCGKCGDWFRERRENAGETARNNGIRGIHWDVKS